MPIPIYVAITAHGFGHATRTAALIDRLLAIAPDVLPIFVTTAPRWLIEKYVHCHFLYRPRALDVGVVQSDSLTMDLPATASKLADLRSQADAIVRAEADFIRLNRVRLVLADMPPLACAIAKAADVPCWMAGNFGWDFIYRAFGAEFKADADWMAELYGQCDRLFRLPFYEAMTAFPHREDVGLTGGDAALTAEQLRQKLGLAGDRPTVLLTFGGLGVDAIPYENLAAYPDWQFVSLDCDVPDLPNLMRLDGQQWRPVDIMPACTQVLIKPGYGTISEAMKAGVPLRCLTRTGFAEAPILLDGIRQHSHHQILSRSQVFEQAWDWLEHPFAPPESDKPLASDGNQVIAEAIATFLTPLKRT
ncbi:MAG: glycosyl transferase [Cyanobacteria bacterium P01_D01_bin.123]